ncbi:hypothetical protein [Neptuniibacter sp. QD37_11]|uniref:hypothetical protein n=1 Tax=Neptuniibacter sp. QD37_11 TaxID=3398209 RepID=UPI0039F4CE69
MITKKYGQDFKCAAKWDDNALTLSVDEVSAPEVGSGVHTRVHASGWVISGEVKEDQYTWVNDFVAYHAQLGFVCGDFEEEVYASSEEAFKHFYLHHTPVSWDYGDI